MILEKRRAVSASFFVFGKHLTKFDFPPNTNKHLMAPLLNLENEKANLTKALNHWFDRAKGHLTAVPAGFDEQVKLLSEIRSDLYEDLNQLQHEAALVAIAEKLQAEFSIDEWRWHPRQTSHPDETDLMGFQKEALIVSVEVTTSSKPKGIIDSRMRDTLARINSKNGRCFYYVISEEMRQRAETKKANNNFYNVEIRKL